jgi:hypothetical protein
MQALRKANGARSHALAWLGAIGRYERLALSLRKAAKRRLDEIDHDLGWMPIRDLEPKSARIKALRKQGAA